MLQKVILICCVHAQANEYTKPAIELGADVAPLDMAFYTGKQFTADYRNRGESVEPFISGWLNEKNKPAGAGRWT
jgi:hypothetical protein